MLLGGDLTVDAGSEGWRMKGACPTVGFIPDSCELFLRDAACLCLPHRQQACSSFSLFNCHGLCCQKIRHQLLAPPPLLSLCLAAAAPASILISFNCSPSAVWTPNLFCGLAYEGQGARSQHSELCESPGLWHQAQSSWHSKVLFLWLYVFKLSMDFAFYFIRHCVRENALKFSQLNDFVLKIETQEDALQLSCDR